MTKVLGFLLDYKMEKCVIFSGAGLSKESGIPTFRDCKDGLWENYKVEDVACHDSWWKNKNLVLDFYRDRTNNVKNCQPNAAHFAIAKLQEKYQVINVTQNIDDLLEKAGCKDIFHLHGSVNYRKCEYHKNISNLDGDTRFICDYKETQTEAVKLNELCPKCNSQLRPDIVWFGEAVDINYRFWERIAETTKIFIGIGTSAQVAPAADFLHIFKKSPQKYFIDINPSLRLKSFTLLKGTACEEMTKLAEIL